MNAKSYFLILIAFCLLFGIVSADTLILYPEADGIVLRSVTSETFSTLIGGAGTGFSNTSTTGSSVYLVSHASTSGRFLQLQRYGMTYNLTPYSGSTINTVTLSMYGFSKTNTFASTINMVISNASPTNPVGWQQSDYNTYGSTLLGNYTYASITAGSWWNSSLSTTYFQSKTGTYAPIIYRNSADYDAVSPTWVADKGFVAGVRMIANGTYKPFLTITYTPPDTTPPASITNLANTTTCNSVNFTWTNPSNADFNGIQYWLNGTIQSPNLSNTTVYKLFTGLAENTQYTFSTKTFDNATPPNVNGTFQNMTALTGYCGIAPVASFTKNQTSGLQPLIVEFTDTSTNIPTIWNWSFGDGSAWQNGTSQNATHMYPTGGMYSPFLIASNTYGSNQSASQTINIYNQTSGTTITPSPASGQTNTAIPLTPSGVNVSANGYSWYFPNGSSIINTTSAPINFIGTVDGGTYSVQLTTTDNGWGASSVNVTVTTEDNTAANFTANITSGLTPLPVLFTDSSTHIPIRFNWSFGDGSPWVNGTDPTPTHIYATGGEYTVILVASNLLSTDTKTRTNYIEVWNRTGIASFNADIVIGDAPLSVTFTDVSYNATDWYTEFGDGNTSTTKSPAFVYNIPGLYTVNHQAYNAHDSTWLNQSNYITVTTPIPVAAFSGVPTTGDAPLSVTFTDASTNTPTSWYWEFGDGNTSTAQNPSNNYGTPGLYSVNLKATNAGGSDWENKTNYINVTAPYVPTPPVAVFSGVPTAGSAPLLVTFTDASTNIPTSWYWEFGDGNTSTAQNPTNTYGTPGTYSVNLRATNADGFDWENKTNYITANVPPTPTPTPTPIPMTPNLNRDARITDPLTWIKNWFNDIRRIER